jgi:lysophospholipase L1-like esterase
MSGFRSDRHRKLKGNRLLTAVAVFLSCVTMASAFLLFNKTPAATIRISQPAAAEAAVKNPAAASSSIPSSSAAQSSDSAQSSAATQSSSQDSSSAPAVKGSLDHAVFIGDSITSGLSLYGNFDESVVFTKNGLTAYSAVNHTYTFNGTKQKVVDAVSAKNPDCIYILLGSNDIEQGYSSEKFVYYYGELIDSLKNKCPNAKIYVQTIFPVTSSYAKSSGVTNEKIDKFNIALEELCSEKNVSYVDVASIMKDSDGTLISSATGDGIHIKKAWYGKWIDYITANQ